MKKEQMIDTLDGYCRLLEKKGYQAIQCRDAAEKRGRLNHALWMCYEIKTFIKEGKTGKANRGFCFGVKSFKKI